MKKKTFAISIFLCALFVIFPVRAAETESDTAPTITFRGFDWYSTRTEVEKALASNGITDGAWMSDRNQIMRATGEQIWATNVSGYDHVDGGGWHAMYSNMTVGGGSPSYSYAYYMYPVSENGTVIKSDDEAQLYFGLYEYKRRDFEELEEVFNDLAAKLSVLYGEYEVVETDYFIRYTWTDSFGNTAKLVHYPDYFVELAYEAGDAEDKLTILQDALDEEVRISQESERLANAQNTDGL